MLVKIHEAQSVKALKTVLLHLLPRTGAWCWRHKVNRQRHKKRWKNFAARTGDPFTPSCGGRASGQRRQRILPRGFLRSYWSAEVSMPSARKKDDFVLICLGH